MTSIDLSGYKLSELKQLQNDVEKAIEDCQRQDVQKARDQILMIAKGAGISVDELLATSAKKVNKGNAKTVKPQYQNPEDSSQTWAGRGRQPKWVTEALASGRNLEDFRIL
jgi:DNA-binding protein H-NS